MWLYLVVKLNIPLPFSKIRIITKLKAVFISQNKSILDEDGSDESLVSIKEECLEPEIEAEISFLEIGYAWNVPGAPMCEFLE